MWLIAIGCSTDGAPVLVPSTLDVTDQARPLSIQGLAAPSYLTTTSNQLVLVADYHAVIGGVETAVGSADATGVMATLARPLPIGSYALDLQAGARSWHVDGALDIIGTASPDAGTTDAVPDAGPDASIGCPVAPLGCSAFSCPSTTSCYYVCAAKAQAAASGQCTSSGLGDLVTIDDHQENDCIAGATHATGPDGVWIGFVQAPDSIEPTGGWGWEVPDGSQFVNWAPAQPDDLGTLEDCGAMTVGGRWDDVTCTSQLRFVCERP